MPTFESIEDELDYFKEMVLILRQHLAEATSLEQFKVQFKEYAGDYVEEFEDNLRAAQEYFDSLPPGE
jgi:hypothetical protein